MFVFNRIISFILIVILIGQSAIGFSSEFEEEEITVTEDTAPYLEDQQGFVVVNISEPDSDGVSYTKVKSINALNGLVINNSRYSRSIKGFGYVESNQNLDKQEAEEIIIEIIGDEQAVFADATFILGKMASIKIISQNDVKFANNRIFNGKNLAVKSSAVYIVDGGLINSADINILAQDIRIAGPVGCNKLSLRTNYESSNLHDIEIEKMGRIVAKEFYMQGRQIKSAAKDLQKENGDKIAGISCENIEIEAENDILLMGGLDSNLNLKLTSHAGSITVWKSNLMALNELSITSAEEIKTIESKLVSRTAFNLEAKYIENISSQYLSRYHISINGETFKHNLSSIDSQGNVNIVAKSFENKLGLITSSGDEYNSINIYSDESVSIDCGDMISKGELAIYSSKIDIRGREINGIGGKYDYQGSLRADGGITIDDSKCQLKNDGGSIVSKTFLNVNAFSLNNLDYTWYKDGSDMHGGVISAKELNFNTIVDFTNSGSIYSQERSNLHITNKFLNEGLIASEKKIDLIGATTVENKNQIIAGMNININLDEESNFNNSGKISANVLNLTAKFAENAGNISVADEAIVNAKKVSNLGLFKTDLRLQLNVDEFVNDGTIEGDVGIVNARYDSTSSGKIIFSDSLFCRITEGSLESEEIEVKNHFFLESQNFYSNKKFSCHKATINVDTIHNRGIFQYEKGVFNYNNFICQGVIKAPEIYIEAENVDSSCQFMTENGTILVLGKEVSIGGDLKGLNNFSVEANNINIKPGASLETKNLAMIASESITNEGSIEYKANHYYEVDGKIFALNAFSADKMTNFGRIHSDKYFSPNVANLFENYGNITSTSNHLLKIPQICNSGYFEGKSFNLHADKIYTNCDGEGALGSFIGGSKFEAIAQNGIAVGDISVEGLISFKSQDEVAHGSVTTNGELLVNTKGHYKARGQLQADKVSIKNSKSISAKDINAKKIKAKSSGEIFINDISAEKDVSLISDGGISHNDLSTNGKVVIQSKWLYYAAGNIKSGKLFIESNSADIKGSVECFSEQSPISFYGKAKNSFHIENELNAPNAVYLFADSLEASEVNAKGLVAQAKNGISLNNIIIDEGVLLRSGDGVSLKTIQSGENVAIFPGGEYFSDAISCNNLFINNATDVKILEPINIKKQAKIYSKGSVDAGDIASKGIIIFAENDINLADINAGGEVAFQTSGSLSHNNLVNRGNTLIIADGYYDTLGSVSFGEMNVNAKGGATFKKGFECTSPNACFLITEGSFVSNGKIDSKGDFSALANHIEVSDISSDNVLNMYSQQLLKANNLNAKEINLFGGQQIDCNALNAPKLELNSPKSNFKSFKAEEEIKIFTNDYPDFEIDTNKLFIVDLNKDQIIYNSTECLPINAKELFYFSGGSFYNYHPQNFQNLVIETNSGNSFVNENLDFVVNGDFSYIGPGSFTNKGKMTVLKHAAIKPGSFLNEKLWEFRKAKTSNKKCPQEQEFEIEGSGEIYAGSIAIQATEGPIENVHGAKIETTDKNTGNMFLKAKKGVDNKHYRRITNEGYELSGKVEYRCHDYFQTCVADVGKKCKSYDLIGSTLKSLGNMTIISEESSITNSGSDILVGKNLFKKARWGVNSYGTIGKYFTHFSKKGRKTRLGRGWKVRWDELIPHHKDVMRESNVIVGGGKTYMESEAGDIVIKGTNVISKSDAFFKSGRDMVVSSTPVHNDCGLGGSLGACGDIAELPSNALNMIGTGEFSSEMSLLGPSTHTGTGSGMTSVGGNIFSEGNIYFDIAKEMNVEAGAIGSLKDINIKAENFKANYWSHSYLDSYKTWYKSSLFKDEEYMEKIYAVAYRPSVLAAKGNIFMNVTEDVDIQGSILHSEEQTTIYAENVRLEHAVESVENYILQKKKTIFSEASRQVRWARPVLIEAAIQANKIKINAEKFHNSGNMLSVNGITLAVDELECEGTKLEKWVITDVETSGFTFPGLAGAALASLDGAKFKDSLKRNVAFYSALDEVFNERKSSTDLAPVINFGVEGYKQVDNIAQHYQNNEGHLGKALAGAAYDMTGITKFGKIYIPGGIGFYGRYSHTEERFTEVIQPHLVVVDGDLDVMVRTGSMESVDISAPRINIYAKESLDILAAKRPKSIFHKESGWHAGLSIGEDNLGVSFGWHDAMRKGSGYDWVYSYITASESIVIQVDGEMLLQGQVSSPDTRVNAEKIIVETLQDTYEIVEEQSGFTLGLNYAGGILLPTGSIMSGEGAGHTLWAREQSFIAGYDNIWINSTDMCLVGGAIFGPDGKVISERINYIDLHDEHKYRYSSFSTSLDLGLAAAMATTSLSWGNFKTAIKDAASASYSAFLGALGYSRASEDAAGIKRATIEAEDIETESDISDLNRDASKASEEFYRTSNYYSFSLPIPNLGENGIGASWDRITYMFEDIIDNAHDTLKTKLEIVQEVTENVLEEVEAGKVSVEEAEDAINESTHFSEVEGNVKILMEYYKENGQEVPAEELEAVLDGWTPVVNEYDELNFVRKDVEITLDEKPTIEINTSPAQSKGEITELYHTEDSRTNIEKVADVLIFFAEKAASFMERHPIFAKWGIPAIRITFQGSIAILSGGSGLVALGVTEGIFQGVFAVAADQIEGVLKGILNEVSNGVRVLLPGLSEERARALAGALLIGATLVGPFAIRKIAGPIREVSSKCINKFKKHLKKTRVSKKTHKNLQSQKDYQKFQKRAKLKVHDGQQGKHIKGHENYIEGKSILDHKNPQALVNKYAGTGVKTRRAGHKLPGEPGYREVVDFKEPIGIHVNQKTGEKIITNFGQIHYGKNGVHIVPETLENARKMGLKIN